MKKALTIVGARPQFVKAAVVTRALKRSSVLDEVMVHTGQHYDESMSGVFFRELEIPPPEYNLGVSGVSHGEMTGIFLMRALLESKGNPRKKILIPDSAHGTNPATASMAG